MSFCGFIFRFSAAFWFGSPQMPLAASLAAAVTTAVTSNGRLARSTGTGIVQNIFAVSWRTETIAVRLTFRTRVGLHRAPHLAPGVHHSSIGRASRRAYDSMPVPDPGPSLPAPPHLRDQAAFERLLPDCCGRRRGLFESSLRHGGSKRLFCG